LDHHSLKSHQSLVTIDSQVTSQVAQKLGDFWANPALTLHVANKGSCGGSLTAADARVFRFAHPASNITEPCRPAPESLQFRPLTTLERVACEGWGWGVNCHALDL